MTSFSDFLFRGLREHGERSFMLGCVALALAYASLLVAFEAFDTPVQETFYARLDAARLKLVGAHPAAIGTPIDVSVGGQVSKQVALLRGWSAVEPWGVWSDGPVASFAISLPSPPHDMLQVRLDCVIKLDADGKQTVLADGNGRPAGRWDLRQPTTVLTIRIPTATIPPSRTVVITLHVLHPSIPAGHRDDRALGVGLRSVTVVTGHPTH